MKTTEIELGDWVRVKIENDGSKSMVTSIGPDGIVEGQNIVLTWDDLKLQGECSKNRGVTWHEIV